MKTGLSEGVREWDLPYHGKKRGWCRYGGGLLSYQKSWKGGAARGEGLSRKPIWGQPIGSVDTQI